MQNAKLCHQQLGQFASKNNLIHSETRVALIR
jgi:hypothetical protein